ncbi:MAG: hypothetical protein ACI35O_15005 [Bacillaceae bacterium]
MQKYVYYGGMLLSIIIKGLVFGLMITSLFIEEIFNLPLFLFLMIASTITQYLAVRWFKEHPDELKKLVDLGLLEDS